MQNPPATNTDTCAFVDYIKRERSSYKAIAQEIVDNIVRPYINRITDEADQYTKMFPLPSHNGDYPFPLIARAISAYTEALNRKVTARIDGQIENAEFCSSVRSELEPFRIKAAMETRQLITENSAVVLGYVPAYVPMVLPATFIADLWMLLKNADEKVPLADTFWRKFKYSFTAIIVDYRHQLDRAMQAINQQFVGETKCKGMMKLWEQMQQYDIEWAKDDAKHLENLVVEWKIQADPKQIKRRTYNHLMLAITEKLEEMDDRAMAIITKIQKYSLYAIEGLQLEDCEEA